MKRERIMPTTYFLVSIVLMVLLHFFCPIRQLVPSPYNYAGIPLILVGVLVNIWASHLFNRANTTVKPFQQSTRLVTEGPYRFSRHPMYAGMAGVLVGLACLLASVVPMLVVPAFIWLMEKGFIGIEERALQETFGQAYLEYKKRVRRWV